MMRDRDVSVAAMTSHPAEQGNKAMMSDLKYVYIYKDPDTLKPFYIGLGEGQRAWGLIMPSVIKQNIKHQPTLYKAISKIVARGKKPVIEFLVQDVPIWEARTIIAGILKEYGEMFVNTMQFSNSYERNYTFDEFDLVPAVRSAETEYHNVYFLRDPITRKVRYIGSGKQERAYHHLRKCWWDNEKRSSGQPRLYAWVKECMENETPPVIDIVHERLTRAQACKIEKEYTEKYGLDNLLNVLLKGDGERLATGTIWINDGKINRRFPKEDSIPDGWSAGRKPRQPAGGNRQTA